MAASTATATAPSSAGVGDALLHAQAFAFRQLVSHLQKRTDVQNIDQMNLAGFCRNCLSKWLYAGFASLGPDYVLDYSACLKEVYGMEYGEWKSKFQKKATKEQMQLFKQNASLHAKHSKQVEEAAKKAKKKKSSGPAAPPPGTKGKDTKETVPLIEVMTSSVLSDACCKSPEEVAAAIAKHDTNQGPAGMALGSALIPPRTPAEVPKNFKIRVAVLTVSDRAFAGIYKDESGPAVESVISKYARETKHDIQVVHGKVVPDDIKEISTSIRSWAHADASESPSLILTTGGTGFSTRDVTPEATKEVSDRLAPALAAGITLASSKKEPFALLSRAQAGICKNSIIFNLPGRPKAVRENLDIALPKLLQAVYQMHMA